MHIRGYGAVHIGGAEFEARKRRKVDLISFDMVIKIELSNLYVPRNTVMSPLTVTRFTPRNSVQKCMNTSTIFDITLKNKFARLVTKKYKIDSNFK